MFKVAIPAAIALSLMLPAVTAQAQTPPARASVEISTPSSYVIRPELVLAVGIGLVGGMVVGEMLFSSDLAAWAVGALGGYVMYLWFDNRRIEVVVR